MLPIAFNCAARSFLAPRLLREFMKTASESVVLAIDALLRSAARTDGADTASRPTYLCRSMHSCAGTRASPAPGCSRACATARRGGTAALLISRRIATRQEQQVSVSRQECGRTKAAEQTRVAGSVGQGKHACTSCFEYVRGDKHGKTAMAARHCTSRVRRLARLGEQGSQPGAAARSPAPPLLA